MEALFCVFLLSFPDTIMRKRASFTLQKMPFYETICHLLQDERWHIGKSLAISKIATRQLPLPRSRPKLYRTFTVR